MLYKKEMTQNCENYLVKQNDHDYNMFFMVTSLSWTFHCPDGIKRDREYLKSASIFSKKKSSGGTQF